MATKSAKMSQDGPTWVAKANEVCYRSALPGSVCAHGEPPRALEFPERKGQKLMAGIGKEFEFDRDLDVVLQFEGLVWMLFVPGLNDLRGQCWQSFALKA